MTPKSFGIPLLLLAWAGPCLAASETQVEVRGYAELAGSRRTIEDSSQVNPNNQLGLDETDGEARLDLNLGLAHGGLRLFAEGYGTASLQDGDGKVSLYQGYLSYSGPSKKYFGRAGKVVPGWGVGQIWNPVRTFENRRDLIFPDLALEGVLLAEAQAYFSSGSLTVLVLPPETQGGLWAYGARVSSALGSLDYSASLVADDEGTVRSGLELSWVLGRMTLVSEAVAINRSRALAVAPNGLTQPRGDGQFFSYVLGANLALPRDFMLVFEHYHDDEAFSVPELDRFLDHLPRTASLYNPFGNGRDNFFLGLNRLLLWHDSSVALNSFYNRESAIGLFQLKGETQLSAHLRLILAVLHFTESSEKRPVNLFGDSLQMRLKWSF